MPRSALFLFAPKFRRFGVDVARRLAEAEGLERIHGICTGSAQVAEAVERDLGPLCGEIHHLAPLEESWLATEPDRAALEAIEARYPPGTAGDTLVADRRLGAGFVFDGLPRPDPFGDRAKAAPLEVPAAWLGGLYGFLDALFERSRPELVFCYAVAGGPAFAMGRAAGVRGLPFAQLSPTRLGAGYMVDDSLRALLAPVRRRFEAGDPTTPEQLEAARAWLAAFRDRPETPEYHRRFDAARAARRPLPEIAKRLRKAASLHLKSLGSGDPERRLRARRKLHEARAIWTEGRIDPALFGRLEDLTGPFVYFPLHVAPEASTMVVSPAHTNQIAVVEALAKALPAHMSLVVKEHAPMLGLRPPGYYETIAAMPRTLLLSPAWRGLDVCARAELTAVITGTAAWEALCLGRPALVIGDAHFLGLGAGAVHAPDLSTLPGAIREALACPPVPDAVLERYIAALLAESFEMPSSLMWDTYEDHPEDQRAAVCAAIAGQLARRMAEHAAGAAAAE